MAASIGDYALLSNLHCAALVSRGGSIDWFCPGRFDAPACFAALLGTDEHGYWSIAPADANARVQRRYQEDSLLLETCFTTATGSVRLIDTMPLGDGCHIVRLVQGLSGTLAMRMMCAPRFGYGRYTPSAYQDAGQPDTVFRWEDDRFLFTTDLNSLEVDGGCARADFEIAAGEQYQMILSYAGADRPLSQPANVRQAIADTNSWWREWADHCQYRGRWQGAVRRSLITLKALTYQPSGGMVAAPTTSLPEVPGGAANYDYRFCWIRDAAFALKVLLNAGYRQEACAWRDWLLECVSRHELHMHALYGVDATVAREEQVLDWLPGYLNSQPVRDGNAASHQYQLDVRGELMEVFHLARDYDLDLSGDAWQLQCKILKRLEESWHQPDEGIWEFRTMHEHLTHSKVLCWVAFDRCIRDAEKFDLEAPVQHWRNIRAAIREDIFRNGVHAEGGYFTQRYGSNNVDASLLMIPLVGFVSADDPRMKATVAAIERELCTDGLVRRYRVGDQANEEGLFLPSSSWLADNYWLAGRHDEAEALFSKLLELCNDLGLLSEEYDPKTHQLLGNFPQGLTHLALISSAKLIATGSEAYTSLT